MRTLEIEWRRVVEGGSTCRRCGSTGENVRRAAAALAKELAPRGVEVRLREETLGRDKVAHSNEIDIDGVPLETFLDGASVSMTRCGSCCSLLDEEEVSCRAIERWGMVHEAIPEAFIREAALRALGGSR